MNNEDKKGLNKFQFSTEIDRADLENTRTIRINPEVLKEEMRKLDAKKGKNSSKKQNHNASNNNSRKNSNHKNSTRKPNSRRTNNRRRSNSNKENREITSGIEKEKKDVFAEDSEKTLELKTPIVEDEPKTKSPTTQPVEILEVLDEDVEPVRKVYIVNDEEEMVKEFVDEIPTAENVAVSISEEDIVPVSESVLEEDDKLSEEEKVEEIPTVENTVPVVEENSHPAEEDVVMEYHDELSTVAEEPVQKNTPLEDVVMEYRDELSTVVEEKPEEKPEEKVDYPLPKKDPNDNLSDTLLEGTLVRDKIFVQEQDSQDRLVEEVQAAMENRDLEDTTTMDPVEPQEVEEHPVHKFYLDFHSRVILLIVGILLLFGTACFIIISTLRSNEVRDVNYLETSSIHYEVCPSTGACLKEGGTYTSNTASKINLNYHYEANFEEKIHPNITYYIVAVNRIYDPKDHDKVFYEDEDYVVERTSYQDKYPISIDMNTKIDYAKYRRFVEDYKKKYTSNIDSTLEVVLYLDDGNETREVSSVTIPLGKSEFKIQRSSVVDEERVYQYEVKDWTNTNTLYIMIGSFFVLLSLFLLFHLTKLAVAVTGKKSKYQEELMAILNEYDRLIVIARDGYESNVEKKVIKLATFDELLNARSVLNKPIIYSRVNNVKSEFIVEDDAVIYKFVLKEADLEK